MPGLCQPWEVLEVEAHERWAGREHFSLEEGDVGGGGRVSRLKEQLVQRP